LMLSNVLIPFSSNGIPSFTLIGVFFAMGPNFSQQM
jgi:hypothetical protein